jgi:hypothetical protein
VLADGKTPTQAYLYHLPEHSPALYDDTMRNQLAIPPVSTSTSKNDDASISSHSVEAPVNVGRDGRARERLARRVARVKEQRVGDARAHDGAARRAGLRKRPPGYFGIGAPPTKLRRPNLWTVNPQKPSTIFGKFGRIHG